MQADFMNEVKYKDNMWHCKTPLPFIIPIRKATGSCESRFSSPLCDYASQFQMYLIKENTERAERKKRTREVKDDGGCNAGEKERNLGMERHVLLRASGNEAKYIEEWPKRPQ